MRKFLTSILALALFIAAPIVAQQPEIKPGPEHMKLKEAEGTWDATIKGKDGDSKGTLMCKVDLNGLWLLEHFTADLGGTKFEGRGATSYDPAKKKYVNVWIDTMSTSPMVTEGNFDAATKTMTMVGNMPTPDGKNMKCTLTTVAKDSNTKHFTLKGVMDGKEFEMVNITYKRRAK
jgi:Protein of unknown function (DUF1579)